MAKGSTHYLSYGVLNESPQISAKDYTVNTYNIPLAGEGLAALSAPSHTYDYLETNVQGSIKY